MSSKTPQKTSPPACPVGEAKCEIIDQLVVLRQENAELSKLVSTDDLTNLFNYRHFIQALDQEMERTRRSKQPTALIILDLDHFKKVNDTWGHEIGNDALKQTATLIKEGLRRLDIPCRYGGEEFVVILPSTDLLVSTLVAERLRNIIASTPLPVPKGEIRLTASLGVDIFTSEQNDTVEEFVKRADEQLYTAKREGRNRVSYTLKTPAPPPGRVNPEEKDALFGLFDEEDGD